jgi:type IV secretion system protein VirB9
MQSRSLGFVLMMSTALTGCATFKLPQIGYDDEQPAEPAILQGEPPRPVQVVEVPRPLPLPGQLKPPPGARAAPEPRDPRERVDRANAAARVQPSRSGYVNAVQVFPFTEGALYQVYAAPGQVTDIALQEGEQLTGSVAAGDTVRWIIGDTESGPANAKKIHILVKPTRPDIITNLVINTDRRTYHMELRSTEKTYMASVSWLYAQDQIIALRRQNEAAEAAMPVDTGLDIDRLRFRYTIEGDAAPWRPLHAFDDGRKVYIQFPRGIAQGEMPPLFVTGPDGNTSELVNYRVRGTHMIVDRLFAAAELRLGDKGTERRVRIVRTDGSGRLAW